MWVWVSVGIEMVVCEMLFSVCFNIPVGSPKVDIWSTSAFVCTNA